MLEIADTKIRPILAGIDTLHLHSTSPLQSPIHQQLERLKTAAIATPPGEALPDWPAAGISFEMRPHASQRGAYLLESPQMAVSVNPSPPKGLPTAIIELRAIHLWGVGYARAAADAEEVLGNLLDTSPNEETGEFPPAQVSRVDVTTDFQGWVPQVSDLARFSCRARRDSCYRHSQELTGWSWGGGGAIIARCYDKRKEISGTDKQHWVPKLWEKSTDYAAAEPVWRLEYQVKRAALREFTSSTGGTMRGWLQLQENLGSLWSTLAGNWLTMRGQRTNSKRKTVDPLWAQLVNAPQWRTVDPNEDLVRIKTEAEFHRTLDQLASYLARGAAERWALDGRKDLWRPTIDRLVHEAELRARRRGRDLHGRAAELFEPLSRQAELKAEKDARIQGLRDDEKQAMWSAAFHQREIGEEG